MNLNCWSEANRLSVFKLQEFSMRATGESKMKVALMERVEISFCDVAFVILWLEYHGFDGGNRRAAVDFLM